MAQAKHRDGTPGNDDLVAGIDFMGTDNLVLGLDGEDIIDSATEGVGWNTLSGGLGSDELFGAEQDQLLGDSGNDILVSDDLGNNPNRNLLLGGAGNDELFPDQEDVVSGGSGDDTIFAGKGNSTIRGGRGNDVFWLANAETPENPNTIQDFNPLEDTLQISLDAIQAFSDLTLTQMGEDVVIGVAGPTETLATVQNTSVSDFIENTNVFVADAGARNNGTSPADESSNIVVGLNFIGQDLLDDNAGFETDDQGRIEFEGTTVGGLSGISYDSLQKVHRAVSDDRSNIDPARFYSLNIDLSNGTLDDGDVSVNQVTSLVDENGNVLAENSADTEGITVTENGSVFISSERDTNGNPEVFEFSLSGQQLQSLLVPEQFIPSSSGTETEVRNNLGFESLTLTPDETLLFTANEGALAQDGEVSTADTGTVVRIAEYDLTGATPQVVGQFLYETDPVPDVATSGPFDTNGLVELLAIDNTGTLLALERSFTNEGGFSGKIYQIRLNNATDISDIDSLAGQDQDPVSKTLLFDLEELADQGITIDNVEGMTLGPVLPNGKQSLVIVSDDNFDSFGSQNNQFLAFELDIAPLPPTSFGARMLSKIGGFRSETGAEISAFDPETNRLFIVSGNETLEILDLTDPTNPTQFGTFDLSILGDGANSVDVKDELVAIAISRTDTNDPDNAIQIPGIVAFFDAGGTLQGQVDVGALPDMVTFTPDGTKVLVANEGEPSEDYTIDPEGSISIIDLTGGVAAATVTTADFRAFNDRKAELDAKGVKLFGQVFDTSGNVVRESTVAEDLEPEFIAVSDDGTQAFVTLQENNAFAVLDLDTSSDTYGKVVDILPLGAKDYKDGQPSVTNFTVDGLGPIANEDGVPLTTSTGQTVDLGGLSGLFYAGTDGDNLKFYSIPDRGPNPSTFREDKNGDGTDDTIRPFGLPDYQARIVEITLNTETGIASVSDQIFLTQTDGTTPITGLSNFVFDAAGNQVDEFPVDADGNDLTLDPFGGDFEGIVWDSTTSTFWMVDEYRPAIYHFDASGALIKRFIAEGTAASAGAPDNTFGAETLPEVYANRRRNRGFEAIALDETNRRGVEGVSEGAGVLYAFIQTPLDNPDSSARHSDVIRILAIDSSTGATIAEYVYFLERNRESGVGVSRVDKIGDAVFDPETGKFFVIERDSAVGADAKKFIFEIDLTGATNILGTPLANEDGSTGSTLEETTVDQLAAAGIQGVDKIKVTNLPSIGYLAGDKPEGLALLPDGRLAVINDNDFGLLDEDDPDPTDGSILLNPNPTPTVLGLIDFAGNTLDASDRDDTINLQNWPLFGLFQPDSVAGFSVGNKQFYVTANEGDARNRPADDGPFGDEGDLFLDEDRAKDVDLDPTAFPNADALQEDEAIGRIDINLTEGDLDGDGDYDQLFAFGARSFSIWDEFGNLVFDSGDDFERIVAQVNPTFFNSDNDENTFDTRSDAKGPEPEGVTVGTIGDRTYAFIGLERVGGIMVYEVTNPNESRFVQYINTRDFGAGLDSEAVLGDSAPEGLKFISAEDSPNGEPLLVVTFEETNTVSIFSVNPPVRISDIQGAGHISPLVGQAVTLVPGIVTAVDSNGFYLQDPTPDSNPDTSDAIFVFTGGAPTVAVSDSVTVDGTVSEFIPGGAGSNNLSITQIGGNPTVTILSNDNELPEAFLIGPSGTLPPNEFVISPDELPEDGSIQPPTQTINLQNAADDAANTFDPAEDGIDFYESLEGMRVTVENPATISPTDRFNQTWVLPTDASDTPAGISPEDGLTNRGTINLASGPDNIGNANPERIQLQFDSGILPIDENFNAGTILDDVTGVVGYSFGNFEVNVTEEVTVETESPLTPEITELVSGENQLTVASYNVLNLTSTLAVENGITDPDAAQRALIAEQIVNNLGSPNIIALQEIQDSNGVEGGANASVSDATQTLQDLVDAIAAAGGPTYAFFDPYTEGTVNDADGIAPQGGVPSGNIRNAFLYDASKIRLDSVEALTPAVLEAAGVTNPQAFNDPDGDPSTDGTRIPLIGNFSFNGESITLINNHLTSRFGSTPIFGAVQPFTQAGEAAREAQTQVLNDYVDFLLGQDPNSRIGVLGDLNTFEFTNDLAEILPGTGDEKVLSNLVDQAVAADEAYTFIFEGNSQVLDHVFVTDNLLNNATAEFDIVHVNNDFTTFGSDHEPVVSRFTIEDNRPELVGFASLPADTFAEGPATGEGIDANGRTGPFDGPPVQGFSGVQFAPSTDRESLWFLSDNGFGSKANSADYLLRLYQVTPNFFDGAEGDGTVNVDSFIQLSDPGNLIPFEITNEGTDERNLTGADFDIESFVMDENGDIWIGDEFGPYLLRFNGNGELLEAPIATPNLFELNTLDGQDPIVIGHRGASGTLPEHTLEAYKLAIEQGADFIEPDLVITSDGFLITRHEPLLDDTTNVAEIFGEDRKSTKLLDGVETTGYFAEDFTLAEIKQLRVVQSRDFRDQSFNGQFEIPTFQEVIELVQQVEADTGKKIGLYPETKHPTFFDLQGLSLEEPLIQTLKDSGFTDPDRLFIQSFEFQNLIKLQGQLDAEGLGQIPLVQLYGDTTEDADPGSTFSVPYDIRYNVQQGNNLAAIYGQDFLDALDSELTEDTIYSDLDSKALLKVISLKYAEGAGPWKNNFLLREGLDTPVDGDGDGNAEITTQLTGEVTSFIEDAHSAGLQVHPYTLRDEERFLTLNPDGTPQTPEQEFEQLIQLGVDGFFTDFPGTGDAVRDQIVGDQVRSPDNPEVLAEDAIANLRRSRGFEGLAISPNRKTLYPLLEGTVTGDPAGALRVYEFDVESRSYEGLVGLYQLDDPSHAIGDLAVINPDEYLVIERDGRQGDEAAFKKIFKVNLAKIDENGVVEKTEVVDLLNIADPNDLNQDGRTYFDFPFVTIEDVLVLDEETILVANDNNYPFSVGRGPDIDNNEIIQIKLNDPLDFDPRIFDIPEPNVEPPQSSTFSLQILHASDLEGGVDAIADAPNFAAVVEGLELEAAKEGIASILLSAGDNYIPGPFFNAAGDRDLRSILQSTYDTLFDLPEGSLTNIREGNGRVDISIMNILEFDASAVGNHEFDAGPGAFGSVIGTDIRGETLDNVRWLGAQFPYLSANLDFSGEGALADLFTSEILPSTDFASNPNGLAGNAPKLAPATVIETDGEKIGVIGATTPILESISSTGEVTVLGEAANSMAALAAILQPVIDDVIDGEDNTLGTDDDVNKVVLISHLQQIALEQELIQLLSGVDIVIAGGSDTLLADETDRLREGDVAGDTYPILTTNRDGDDAAIVSTDGQYSYVGRLVLDFDSEGKIITDSLDPEVSGAFAADETTVSALWGTEDAFAEGTKAGAIKTLTDAVQDIVTEADASIFGLSEVFLEGRRQEIRTEETNLGNLTADANLAAAKTLDETVVVSIKNGGGIRDAIGAIDGTTGEELPTEANPLSGKKVGQISQLDIENALRFNNQLTLLTVTATELKQILEHAVAATEDGATPGQFPQVGGLAFSFDPAGTPIVFDNDGAVTTEGSRIQSLAILNKDGLIQDVVVENGEVVGDINRDIRLVTLNFLAGGGDGYPFPAFGSDVINTEIGEQKALADFLSANFPADNDVSTPAFSMLDVAPEEDTRIQNLAVRMDTVLEGLNTAPMADADTYSTPPNTTLTITAQMGVLNGDTDAEGDPLTAELVSGPSHGQLNLKEDGSFEYHPDSNFTGTDSFTYIAFDNQLKSNEATVSIEVRSSGSGVGTPGDDDLVASIDFDGIRDRLFTGAGNDVIDLAINSNASKNRVNAGSGDDLIFVSFRDRIFGASGDDTLDATDSRGKNRMSGGPGDDTFFFGDLNNARDRGIGGSGKDRFFFGLGGGNIAAGGQDADQFWIVNAELPNSANTITDFELGIDIIGLQGMDDTALGVNGMSIEAIATGSGTILEMDGHGVSTLRGINPESLYLFDEVEHDGVFFIGSRSQAEAAAFNHGMMGC